MQIADNRQVQAHGRGPQGEFEAQYHYDALGRRSRKAVRYKGKTEQTTRFLWQGYRLLQEQRDDGSRRSGATIRPARGARWRRWSRRATAARQIFTGITPI